MSLGSTFRRRVTDMVATRTSGPAAGVRVAQVARDALAELVRSGQASPVYTTFVDGRQGVPEERVRLDGGTIAYLFSSLAEAAAYALTYAVQRSPSKSGRYKAAWFVAVNGRPWTAPLATIPAGSEVLVTNREPYHRKIDVGGQITSVPPGIVEDTRQVVMRRFPSLQVSRSLVTLPGGYVLKGRARESGLSYDRKAKSWTRLHAPRPSNRKDRTGGQLMTYPAVVITERGS